MSQELLPKNAICWVPQLICDTNYNGRDIVTVNELVRSPMFAAVLRGQWVRSPAAQEMMGILQGALDTLATPEAEPLAIAPGLQADLTELARTHQDEIQTPNVARERGLPEETEPGRQQTEIEDLIAELKRRGVETDTKPRVSSTVMKAVEELLEGWRKRNPRWEEPTHLIGGNGAISAQKGARLAQSGPAGSSEMPEVVFAGMVHDSFEAHLNKMVGLDPDANSETAPGTGPGEEARKARVMATRSRLLEEVFPEALRKPTPHEYRTLAISAARQKLMLNVDTGEGSPLLDVSDQMVVKPPPKEARLSFSTFAEDICKYLREPLHAGGTKALALASTKSGAPTEWRVLVDDFKMKFSTKFGQDAEPFIFVSTSGFRTRENETAKDMFEQVFCEADAISMSLDELIELHSGVEGPNPEMPAAQKLRELPMAKALKVCHSPSGAIMDLLNYPSEAITHKHHKTQPAEFFQECLRWAVDGTTAALDDPEGRNLDFQQVRTYSEAVGEKRQEDAFRVDFIHPDQMRGLPAGMIGIASPYVARPRGALVGLGAIFDGILLANLLRHEAE